MLQGDLSPLKRKLVAILSVVEEQQQRCGLSHSSSARVQTQAHGAKILRYPRLLRHGDGERLVVINGQDQSG